MTIVRRTRIRCVLHAAIVTLLPAVAAAEGTAAYDWQLPAGFPEPAVPADNPMSESKVALGRRLFFEPRLSLTGNFSCASCHAPEHAFSDSRDVSTGATGEVLPLNAMALVNIAYNVSYGWTKPAVRSLEAQMLEPLLNDHPVEMGLKGREQLVMAELSRDSSYRQAFSAAFPMTFPGAFPGAFPTESAMTFDHLVKAIAAFERTLISGSSAFDRYVFGGDHAALSDEAKRGMSVFFSNQAGCAGCHSGFNFSGNWHDAQGTTGGAAFATNGTSAQPMRVPTLRNIALTSPYMHDGRFATLDAVLDHYSSLGARKDPRLPATQLTAVQQRELSAFLQSLTDTAFVARFAGE